MYLKSLTLKGFKSFPDRTRLDFGPGVSVVVGPNGSGKSNLTDAILWVLGEQSPLAVRGQSMRDVIFGGGPGVQARSFAEVELLLDNGDGTIPLPASEISVRRRLDRSGEGEYSLNGARCRLGDVLEALSDTGLGKEAHSVVSQGRIESIVTSSARERRLLIEEAAGLAKHRKRRRRAQLKLERTQQNLDRALDVEREARSRLRPLERQARAAELHARLERQTLEARLALARHAWVSGRAELDVAGRAAESARGERERVDGELRSVMARRAAAERALTERTERNEALTRRLYGARSALERLQVRSEQLGTLGGAIGERLVSAEAELRVFRTSPPASGEDAAGDAGQGDRIAVLEAELADVDTRYQRELEAETAALERDRAERAAERARLEPQVAEARAMRARAEERVGAERGGTLWPESWEEVRQVIAEGVERLLALPSEPERTRAVAELVARAERVARAAVEHALGKVQAAEEASAEAEQALRDVERQLSEAAERERQAAWTIEQRRAAAEHGALAVRRAQLRGELAAERRQAERLAAERARHEERMERLQARHDEDRVLLPLVQRLGGAAARAAEAAAGRLAELDAQVAEHRALGGEVSSELRSCAREEAEIQSRLRDAGEALMAAEIAVGRASDRVAESERELHELSGRLELALEQAELAEGALLGEDELAALAGRLERLRRRREQLGPVNPLAQQEYAEALAHAKELAEQRSDLEDALRELRAVIREADRRIRETFESTLASVARNFEAVIGEVFPGGSGRIRLVDEEPSRRAVLGGAVPAEGASEGAGGAAAPDGAGTAPGEQSEGDGEEALAERLPGVEIEVTPAGKSARRLSLLSGGEKSMAALAFLFAVFLAHPCPFYVLDEVEAALDDLNLNRFVALLRRCAERAQFIVMTHQKRTMEAADWLYGVSMGKDGVSKVVSRRLGAPEHGEQPEAQREGEGRIAVVPAAPSVEERRELAVGAG